ncbi:MAG: 2,4-dienoyl-CoA reductase-like NADH-dependent reductase (Old Yellow Enzyme family) [Planctomycetota bacterium]|jgi:2,4-dienoyl-CoA reductase-like NADH-dependent reductase (Old Yellow Enzyme family)
MVPWRSNEDGEVTPAVLDWYGRFADGRPGVLVVEATGIRDVPSGPLLRIGHDRYLPGLAELVRVVRERSGGQTRLMIQIIDFLRIRRRPEKEAFLRRFLTVDEQLRESLAKGPTTTELATLAEADLREALIALPHEELLLALNEQQREALEYGARERAWDLNVPHIASLPQELPELFANAAQRARRAGFDGVELHYAHAYTMASFLSRRNTRDDGYGSDQTGRLRLPLEVFHAVRERVGSDFCVGCRFLGDEVIDAGSRIDDAVAYARAFAAAGMDFLSVSKGGKFEDAAQPRVGQAAYPYTGPSGHECMPTIYASAPGPFGRNLGLSHRIRAAVRADGFTTPIVGAGGIGEFTQAEQALLEGDCDLVGAARQSLADPDWWLKVERGEGAHVRRCEYTNYCEALDQRHLEVTCRLWDRNFDAPDPGRATGDDIAMSSDGKRRLLPPHTP